MDGLGVWCCVIRWFKPRPTNARLSTLFFFSQLSVGLVLFFSTLPRGKKKKQRGQGPAPRQEVLLLALLLN